MRSVPKRDLNQRTAEVLLEVEEHGPVLITERGVAKWRIESVSPEGASGLAVSRKVRQPGGWKRVVRHHVPEPSSRTLDEHRSDRA